MLMRSPGITAKAGGIGSARDMGSAGGIGSARGPPACAGASSTDRDAGFLSGCFVGRSDPGLPADGASGVLDERRDSGLGLGRVGRGDPGAAP